MNEIEEEIRRQMVAERQRALQTTPAAPPAPPVSAPEPPKPPSRFEGWKNQGGWLGALVTIALLLLKFGAPLLALLGKLKFVLVAAKALPFTKVLFTGGTMLLSMWLEALYFGWPFAIGLVLLIFIHECGHAWAAHVRGIPTTGMVFIPFMGAAVFRNRFGKNVAEDAFIGIMGPVFGTLGGVLCVVIYLVTQAPFWLYLAQFNFFMNLFNLAPTAPLDGGWIVPVFSPKLLLLGVAALFVLAPRNPLIWLLALMSLPRILGGWKAKPEEQPYFRATPGDRWKYGLAYVGLAGFLALSHLGLRDYLDENHRVPRRTPQRVAMTMLP